MSPSGKPNCLSTGASRQVWGGKAEVEGGWLGEGLEQGRIAGGESLQVATPETDFVHEEFLSEGRVFAIVILAI